MTQNVELGLGFIVRVISKGTLNWDSQGMPEIAGSSLIWGLGPRNWWCPEYRLLASEVQGLPKQLQMTAFPIVFWVFHAPLGSRLKPLVILSTSYLCHFVNVVFEWPLKREDRRNVTSHSPDENLSTVWPVSSAIRGFFTTTWPRDVRVKIFHPFLLSRASLALLETLTKIWTNMMKYLNHYFISYRFTSYVVFK